MPGIDNRPEPTQPSVFPFDKRKPVDDATARYLLAKLVEDLQVLMAQQDERIAALEAALRALVERSTDGYVVRDAGRYSCGYCYREWTMGLAESHDADCPVTVARALLSDASDE